MIAVEATAYCLSGTMANGRPVHVGAVASNDYRLGTLIRLSKPVMGRRYFRVEDRIGHGTQLDVWTPSCSWAINVFGRRIVRFQVVTSKLMARWQPKRQRRTDDVLGPRA